jgi:hypothetical protein
MPRRLRFAPGKQQERQHLAVTSMRVLAKHIELDSFHALSAQADARLGRDDTGRDGVGLLDWLVCY